MVPAPCPAPLAKPFCWRRPAAFEGMASEKGAWALPHAAPAVGQLWASPLSPACEMQKGNCARCRTVSSTKCAAGGACRRGAEPASLAPLLKQGPQKDLPATPSSLTFFH